MGNMASLVLTQEWVSYISGDDHHSCNPLFLSVHPNPGSPPELWWGFHSIQDCSFSVALRNWRRLQIDCPLLRNSVPHSEVIQSVKTNTCIQFVNYHVMFQMSGIDCPLKGFCLFVCLFFFLYDWIKWSNDLKVLQNPRLK